MFDNEKTNDPETEEKAELAEELTSGAEEPGEPAAEDGSESLPEERADAVEDPSTDAADTVEDQSTDGADAVEDPSTNAADAEEESVSPAEAEKPEEEAIAEEAGSETPPPEAENTNKTSRATVVLSVTAIILAAATVVLFLLFLSTNRKLGKLIEDSGRRNDQTTVVDQPSEDKQTPAQPDIPIFDPEALSSDNSIVRVAAACSPSVVTVKVVTDSGSGSGSGVVWSADGYIVTNNHVVEDAVSARVVFADGSSYAATTLARDPETDLALLRINASGLYPVTAGSNENILVGETVVAIGNPLGTLANTVTEGIVSALARDITIDGMTYHVMQISAAINPGNSGGGCFNARGELIGIVNSKKYATGIEGLAFAIPVDTVKSVIGDMVKNDKSILQKSLGVTSCYEVTKENYSDYSSSYLSRLEQLNGAPIYGIYIYGDGYVSYTEGSDQLVGGDILISIDGQEIKTLDGINNFLKNKNEGDVVTLKVYRLMSSGFFNPRYSLETKEITVRVVMMYR